MKSNPGGPTFGSIRHLTMVLVAAFALSSSSSMAQQTQTATPQETPSSTPVQSGRPALPPPPLNPTGDAPQTSAQGDGALPGVSSDLRYFDFFVVKGGWIAYLIIILSVVAMSLTLEHCVTIRRKTIVPTQAIEQLKSLIDERQYVEAVRYTAEDPSMLGNVLHAALREAANGFSAMERALEEALEERSAKLYRKIEYLNIIGAVTPMIGLFGTVVGMILLFAAIHAADTFPRAQVVADKVAIALIATFWGLAVAIPSLSIYSIFRNRIEVLTAECAIAADRVLAVFKPAPQPAAGTPKLPATPLPARPAHAT